MRLPPRRTRAEDGELISGAAAIVSNFLAVSADEVYIYIDSFFSFLFFLRIIDPLGCRRCRKADNMMNVYKSLQSYLGVPEDRRSDAEPKGIGSILAWSPTVGEDTEGKQRSGKSLRRTLSADMPSQASTGREIPLKKNCSSFELFCNNSSFSSSSDSEEPARDEDCLSLADEEDDQNNDIVNIFESDDEERSSWSGMPSRSPDEVANSDGFASLVALCGAKKESESCSPWQANCKPKRSVLLSAQSLQLCTEGLGCESGSDCSSQAALGELSNDSSASEDSSISPNSSLENPSEDDCAFASTDEDEDLYDDHFDRKASEGARCLQWTRSFPPPLPSISRANGPCVHMRSYKKDGRFLLQAVKVPSHNYLQAHREGGRLKLRFIKPNDECSYNNTRLLPHLESEHPDIESVETQEFVESADQLEELLDASENINRKSQHVTDSNFASENPGKDASSPQIIKQLDSNEMHHCRLLNSRERTAKSDHNLEEFSDKEFNSRSPNFNLDFKPERLNDSKNLSLFKGLRSTEPQICSSNRCKDERPEFAQLKSPSQVPEIYDGSNETDQRAVDAIADSTENSSYVTSNVYSGWKAESLSNRSTQSLMTSPSLLSYPLNRIRFPPSAVNESSHSLPKFPLKEGFGRCKERKCLSIWEPYCVASS